MTTIVHALHVACEEIDAMQDDIARLGETLSQIGLYYPKDYDVYYNSSFMWWGQPQERILSIEITLSEQQFMFLYMRLSDPETGPIIRVIR